MWPEMNLERISAFLVLAICSKMTSPTTLPLGKEKRSRNSYKPESLLTFFIVQPTAPVKSHSADMLLDLDEKTSQASRYSGCSLERRNSSLSGIDLADLVELEGESFEIETEFHENDSFFSFDFRPAPEDEYDYASLMGEHNNSPNGAQEPPVLNEKSTACNLISIGDCFHDCESLKELDLDLKDTFKKTVKLIEFPEIAQVIKQVKELEMHLDMIVKAKRDLDLVVDKSHL